MTKTLTLILTIFTLSFISGCNGTKPCPPCPKTKCYYPKLPTFKTPKSKSFSVKKYSETQSIIDNKILIELVKNNAKLRKICSNYAVINKRVNKEYQKDQNLKNTHKNL